MTFAPRHLIRPAMLGPILGPILVLASAVAFSLAGLFTRALPTDVGTIPFWRGIFAGTLITGAILWQFRDEAWPVSRGIGRIGVLTAACSTGGTVCFINALRQTDVADVAVINATAPFMAAAMAWLWYREPSSTVTLVGSILALVGVVVMFDTSMSGAHLVGAGLALVMTILMALMMVLIRHARVRSMLPATALSAFACSVVVLPFAHPFAINGQEFAMLALFGTAQFGLGLLLLTLGNRMISATRTSLIGSVEMPLAPLWVWLAFGEVPGLLVLIGGAIVLAGVVLDIVAQPPPVPVEGR